MNPLIEKIITVLGVLLCVFFVIAIFTQVIFYLSGGRCIGYETINYYKCKEGKQ